MDRTSSPPTVATSSEPGSDEPPLPNGWTSEPPRREGYFWYWNEDANEPALLRVYRHTGGDTYLAFTADYRKFAVDQLDGFWHWGGSFGEPEPPTPPSR